MRTIIETNFAAPMLDEPIDHHYVWEGHFSVARFTPERPYMTTLRLYTCKAITMYDQERRRGLLAHLSYTDYPALSLASIVAGYEVDLSATDIRVVQATVRDEACWPGLEQITNYFLAHNPRSITLDRNLEDREIRGIALSLEDGAVFEVDEESLVSRSPLPDISRNRPIAT